MPATRLAQFERDLLRARDLVGLGDSYAHLTHGVVDSSDIFRASLVQSIAAVDHYFHGVILDLATDVLLGRRVPGNSSKVTLGFNVVQDILAAEGVVEQERLARTHIAQRLSRETFQKAESIANGLSLVGVTKVWDAAFPDKSSSPRKHLDLIVDRRNKIVHQSDSDPLSFGEPTVIDKVDALDAVQIMETVVRGIDPLCM